MPTAPNTENYTVPGGIKLYVNTGAGERDLGNIVEIDLEPGADILEHFTNRSGKRAKDKEIVLEDKLTINFTMDEPNFENMRLYFRGGDTVLEGDSTAAIAAAPGLNVTLDGTNFVSVGPYYGLSAVTVRQFLDYCFLYSGTTFTDNSIEADATGGVAFTGPTDADDALYLGKMTPFKEVYFDFLVNGSYGAVVVQYWKDTGAWTAVGSLAGAAAALAADGKMNWAVPADWIMNEINGITAYFIKITATTPWTTPCTINHIRQNAVVNVDYTLDAGIATPTDRKDGRIARLSGGFLGADEEVKLNFTYVTWVSQKMAISSLPTIEGEIRLECFPSSGRGINWEVYFGKASLKPKGAMKLDDKTWLPVPMTIEVLDNYAVDPVYPFGWFRNYENAT